MLFFSPYDWLLLPAIALAMYAQFKVRSTFSHYSRVRAAAGMTGAQVAANILRANGISDVNIEETGGTLSDHYDPRKKVLRLSSGVYSSDSIAALGVAAHEAGHAAQHATGYLPLRLRHSLVPLANFGSSLAIPLFLVGLMLGAVGLMNLGILLFSGAVLFQVVTLPVEFDASRRALAQLRSGHLLREEELSGARRVLSAAALTYIAATAVAVVHLLRLVMMRSSRE
ncbi:MAG: zinc metallopeptidase [candidate division KSB1 bacterium]|nr:zinc metallopeptidase [candidate division KSB1 bacterium]